MCGFLAGHLRLALGLGINLLSCKRGGFAVSKTFNELSTVRGLCSFGGVSLPLAGRLVHS